MNSIFLEFATVCNIFASGADSKTTVLCTLQSDQLYTYSNLLHSLKDRRSTVHQCPIECKNKILLVLGYKKVPRFIH